MHPVDNDVKLWQAKWVLLNIYSLENASSIIVK